ncbi:MAG: glycosyltransferase family A protein [Actinomycetota bacterium]|nr:glycosyltransferase family A protein [Actinomycetota bacterium]
MHLLQRLRATRSGRRSSRRPPFEPAVSVVINTLDRRDHLERTLVSLRDQTYANFEVVVVNGPSADGTDAMLDTFGSSVRRGSCAEARLGLSRNIGAALAAGEILAYIDDDAIPEPDWLERLVACYADETVDGAGGPVFDVPLDRVLWKLCTCDRLGNPAFDASGPWQQYVAVGADPFLYFAGCNMSFRREALRSVGGFNQAIQYGYDDVEVCCRLVDAGHRIVYAEKALVHHDRAASAIRDGHHTIKDPYAMLLSRAMFVLQNAHPAGTPEELAQHVMSWADEWVAEADRQLADGRLLPSDHTRFVQRAHDAATAGIGHGDRPWTELPEHPPAPLLPYR